MGCIGCPTLLAAFPKRCQYLNRHKTPTTSEPCFPPVTKSCSNAPPARHYQHDGCKVLRNHLRHRHLTTRRESGMQQRHKETWRAKHPTFVQKARCREKPRLQTRRNMGPTRMLRQHKRQFPFWCAVMSLSSYALLLCLVMKSV